MWLWILTTFRCLNQLLNALNSKIEVLSLCLTRQVFYASTQRRNIVTMRNTKDSFHARNNLGVTPLPQLRRGNCDDWGVFSDKSGFKDWPELRQTAKDCNDWIEGTCRAAVGRLHEFTKLAREWQQDTMFMSSITQMVIHPSYQRIIGMGQPAVPLILKELQQNPSYWFWALGAITGQNPAEKAGTFDEVVEAWLKWGHAKGYIR